VDSDFTNLVVSLLDVVAISFFLILLVSIALLCWKAPQRNHPGGGSRELERDRREG